MPTHGKTRSKELRFLPHNITGKVTGPVNELMISLEHISGSICLWGPWPAHHSMPVLLALLGGPQKPSPKPCLVSTPCLSMKNFSFSTFGGSLLQSSRMDFSSSTSSRMFLPTVHTDLPAFNSPVTQEPESSTFDVILQRGRGNTSPGTP